MQGFKPFVSDLRPRVWWRVVLALGVGSGAFAQGEPRSVREALRESLPKYDPSVRERALADKAAAETKAGAEAATPARTNESGEQASEEESGSIRLPEVIVEEHRAQPRPLPHMHRPVPPGKANLEPFVSPAERDRELVKKHFTPLERAMNRLHLPLVGAPLAAHAREAEAKLQYANQLDQLAAMIAYMESQGASKEEIAELRALYMDLYLARPR